MKITYLIDTDWIVHYLLGEGEDVMMWRLVGAGIRNTGRSLDTSDINSLVIGKPDGAG